MCFKPSEQDRAEWEVREEVERITESRQESPAWNTHPRENGEADQEEVDRSVEKLAMVLGH
jgi:hypothetical protein